MSVPSDGMGLEEIRDHVAASADQMAAGGDVEGLVVLVKALADELVRVSRVAEQGIGERSWGRTLRWWRRGR